MSDLVHIEAEHLLRAVALERWKLVVRAEPWASLLRVEPHVSSRTSYDLLLASSRLTQGRWLASLAATAAKRAGDRAIEIAEIGTSAGISGLYLLVGMSQAAGGHLTTFEGDEQLAALAKYQFQAFIDRHALRGVSFEVRVGRFEKTVPEFFSSSNKPLDLVFVDGNHREEPTIEYHRLSHSRLAPRGIIVHDDIAWSDGMERAWQSIKNAEASKVTELMLGGRPSRGVVYVGDPKTAVVERHNLDRVGERFARRIVRRIADSRASRA